LTIGERVKELRLRKGLTQDQLGKLARLGHNQISIIETNRSEISSRVLSAVAEALGVDPMELSGDREAWYFVKLDPLAYLPRRAHEDDAGFDLMSPKYDLIPAKGYTIIDTGVHVAIPKGHAALICPKSGLNFRSGILSDGLIDSGYTGSIKVKLYNLSDNTYEIHPGDKISQIVFIRVVEPLLIESIKLPETERGDNGFGSTGR
jgi:dUTP pyrophosphatase